MSRPLKTALIIAFIAALPIECINIVVLGMQPIKGYTAGHPTQFERIRDLEQGILHFPGLYLGIGVFRLLGDHAPQLAIVLGLSIFFLCGYLETALLLAGILWCARSLYAFTQKRAPNPS
jgi:hypothetical protein